MKGQCGWQVKRKKKKVSHFKIKGRFTAYRITITKYSWPSSGYQSVQISDQVHHHNPWSTDIQKHRVSEICEMIFLNANKLLK